ncbi:hypothetical protein B566_EDAN009801, partial [Ephemera danica]
MATYVDRKVSETYDDVTTPRDLGQEESILLDVVLKSRKRISAKKLAASPLPFSVNHDSYILGVQMYARREQELGDYIENVELVLKGPGDLILTSTTFHGQVKFDYLINLRFDRPCAVSANMVYTLKVTFSNPKVRHWYSLRQKISNKSSTEGDLVIAVREEVRSPIWVINVAKKMAGA